MRAKRASLTRPTGVWSERKKLSVSFKPRSPFSAFVKLFVRRVYLDTQKYRLFCSLLLNLLSLTGILTPFTCESFRDEFLACNHVTRQPCWWCVSGQYNRCFFRRIYMKIEFSSQRRETLFVLNHQHTTVTSRANQQLLM